MRLFALSLALSTLATSALAGEEKGSWAVDLEATPNQRLGFGYYVSDKFSLRPSLGGGYSSLNGAFANLGLDLRFELRPTKKVTPYAMAGLVYLHNRSSIDPGAATPVSIRDPHAARLGAGLGLRTRLTDRLSVFAEGRVTRMAFDDLVGTTDRGRFRLEAPTRFQIGFGFTFRLK
ncbi:MAG TPA: outer membrane beta-barrel protein [Vicinamibacteria bacterium]|jgi:opacity protein-like surface antigen